MPDNDVVVLRLVAVVAVLLGAGTAWADDSFRVLFIGNSHTYVNDLPGLFAGLSEAGGRSVRTDASAISGYSLDDHANAQATLDKIAQDSWDCVALQEQSVIPTIHYWRYNSMYPAARLLDSLIRLQGAQTVFYMTWGWKYGGQQSYKDSTSPDFRDYFEMQESVRVAYQEIAAELGATMSPVGLAFARARQIDSLVDLWQVDYCHATLEGTYLGACVFYAVLYGADPTGLEFYGGLSPEDARFCQEVAWQTVSGIEESPRPQAASHKPTATVVGELRAGAVVYDESGADVTARAGALGRGVYFVREERAGSREQSADGGQRSAVSVRKVVVVR
ncbi:MAG: hypothetical protein NTX53_14680 [candidate division WOR-3 bacterium]|nr:hypothetical protein [candidate division WOR-3 bacterium]